MADWNPTGAHVSKKAKRMARYFVEGPEGVRHDWALAARAAGYVNTPPIDHPAINDLIANYETAEDRLAQAQDALARAAEAARERERQANEPPPTPYGLEERQRRSEERLKAERDAPSEWRAMAEEARSIIYAASIGDTDISHQQLQALKLVLSEAQELYEKATSEQAVIVLPSLGEPADADVCPRCMSRISRDGFVP